MNEAIHYALENLEETRDIFDVIYDMQKAVQQGFDTAVREAVPKWYGSDWECHADDLYDDNGIYMYRKDLKYEGSSDAKIYICLFFNSRGKEANTIWQFMDTSSRYDEYKDGFRVQCYSSDKNVSNEILNHSKMDNLANAGFEKRGKSKPWLEMKNSLSFKPDAILQGLKDDDWEKALAPLKDAWDPLVENIDWDALATMLK